MAATSTTTADPSTGATREASGSGARTWVALVGFVLLAEAAGLIGVPFTERGAWFRALDKPWFNPPSSVFTPVWTTLYVLIGVAGWRVWRTRPSVERTRTLGLWGAQLVLNALWTPLFFGAQRPGWALVEICVLWAAVALLMAWCWRLDRPAGALLVPYLAWVSFATVLNAGFVILN